MMLLQFWWWSLIFWWRVKEKLWEWWWHAAITIHLIRCGLMTTGLCFWEFVIPSYRNPVTSKVDPNIFLNVLIFVVKWLSCVEKALCFSIFLVFFLLENIFWQFCRIVLMGHLKCEGKKQQLRNLSLLSTLVISEFFQAMRLRSACSIMSLLKPSFVQFVIQKKGVFLVVGSF